MQQAAKTASEPPLRRVIVALPESDAALATMQSAFAQSGQDPETALLDYEAEGAENALLALLQEAITQLPDDVQHYVRLRFGTTPETPPRDIARLMDCSIAEVYRLRQQTFALLKARLHAHGR